MKNKKIRLKKSTIKKAHTLCYIQKKNSLSQSVRKKSINIIHMLVRIYVRDFQLHFDSFRPCFYPISLISSLHFFYCELESNKL
jgi:hypothetical protein